MAMAVSRASGTPLYQPDAGLIANVPATMVPDRACTECDNVQFFDGKIVVRPGFQVDSVLSPLIPDPTHIINHLGTMVTQAQEYFLTHVEAKGTAATVFAFSTPTAGRTQINSTLLFCDPSGQRPTSTQFKGEWLLATTGSNLQRWIGTGMLVDVSTAQTNAALQCPGNPYFVCSTASRVFVANAIDNATGLRVPWRVWYSDTLNSGVWSNGGGLPEQGSSGYQDLLHESSPIKGMIFQGGTRVVVLKAHSIYRSSWVGSPVWYDFLPISKTRGLAATHSLQEWNDILIFLGDDYNVYMLAKDNSINAVGDPIWPILRDLVNEFFSYAITSWVDHTRGLYHLIIPYNQYGVVVNKIFTLNLKTGAWGMGTLASTSLQMASALWYRPSPPFFLIRPISILGGTDGQIYSVDYTDHTMADGDVKFTATWWGKAQDLMALMQGKGETAEFSKAAIQGETGTAQPQIRMGKSLKELKADAKQYRFDGMDFDAANPDAYVTKRVDAERYGQFGIHWPLGISNPAEVQGFTAWGLPRGAAR